MGHVEIETLEQEEARLERRYLEWVRAFRIATGQFHAADNCQQP